MTDIIGGNLQLRCFDASTGLFEFDIDRRFQNLCERALDISKQDELMAIVGLKRDVLRFVRAETQEPADQLIENFRGAAVLNARANLHVLAVPVELGALNILSANLPLLLGHSVNVDLLAYLGPWECRSEATGLRQITKINHLRLEAK